MGVGFRPTPKLGFPIQRHFVTTPPSMLSSSHVKGREACFSFARLPFMSVASDEVDMFNKDHALRTYAYNSPVLDTLENDCLQMEDAKMNAGKRSRFGLLMENLEMLESSFSDSDSLKLEREILCQLSKLGALNLFESCYLRNLNTSNIMDLSELLVKKDGLDSDMNTTTEDSATKVIVRTGKKEERKSRRERASSRNGLKTTYKNPSFASFDNNAPSSKHRRLALSRHEAEMSKGIKVVSDLERIRAILEGETGKVASLNCWAEAAGLDIKVLQQQLHYGWHCRDELLRSTRSLVLFLARNYRGSGIASEDFLQAGYNGVLQGAERFDPEKGCRFSTYVRYWIKRSMSKTVDMHARAIKIPRMLNKAINQIQSARKTLTNSLGKIPDNVTIARWTGLPLARIESASKCFRVVGSIDQKLGDTSNAKFLEFIPDVTIRTPQEYVMRQHMKDDIHSLLRGLGTRERQLLVMRYGLNGNQPKSLAEIGKEFQVSKEWARQIERKVMTRLKGDKEIRLNLNHYMNL